MATTESVEKKEFGAEGNPNTIVPCEEVRRFMIDSMVSVGTSRTHAEQLSNVLIVADSRGHYSHGLNRLEMYVKEVKSGMCNGTVSPCIEKESASTGLVDGKNTLGPVVGKFSMNLAIKKAKETGVGWVVAKGSNHFSIAGYYGLLALKEGLMGMAFTNCSPLVAPTRGSKRTLGTNPICCAAPALEKDSFFLDMATATVAQGKVEVQCRKKEPLPAGWAMDSKGEMTTVAEEGVVGALYPLGGPEINSGYKGYGLAVMVEIFCAILSGSNFGLNLRPWLSNTREANLGQCFIAVDPSFFAPGFEGRLSELMGMCRDTEPSDPSKPILIPGDPERSNEQKVEKNGGIEYHINQLKDSLRLAKELGVKPMS